MLMTDFGFLGSAFLAGLLTFFAPCTLPLVPAYLGFISGVSAKGSATSLDERRARWRIFRNGVGFVLGFSAVFIAFGLLLGSAGMFVGESRIWISRIGGAFVVLFGLIILDAVRIRFLARDWHPRIPAIARPGSPANAFVLGTAFAAGWTPCVGPILGSILFIAASAGGALEGALLLAVYSSGLAVPFLAIALGIGSAAGSLERFAGALRVISRIGGLLLIAMGILLMFGQGSYLIAESYRLLRFINYDRLLDYL